MILELCRSQYYGSWHHEVLESVQEHISRDVEYVEDEMLNLFYDFLHKEPYYYWQEEVYQQTVNNLESLKDNYPGELYITEDIIEYFLYGLNAYKQTVEVMNDIRKINYNPEIKTRIYRLPTYNSIVEGCLSNLYRSILLLLDQTTNKDYKSQNQLNPICTILANNNFDLLISDINIDIRNAINHGGVIYKIESASPVIEFKFSKNREYQTLQIPLYEFDSLIDNVLDTASSIILGLVTFFNNNKGIFEINLNEKLFIPFSYLALELSIPEARCYNINGLSNDKQLNIDMFIEKTDPDYIHQMAIMISVMVYARYSDYEKYMISFKGERMQTGWIRFNNNEVNQMVTDANSFERVLNMAIKRGDYLIWPASTEEIDLNEVKYFRFPNYKDDSYTITNIEDASLLDRKRLRAHLYIGNLDTREDIIKAIRDSIDWLRKIKNVPSPTMKVKYGIMEADSIYLKVYRKDTRKNKNLFLDNSNFICMVDYNIDGKTTLKHGGIGARLWNKFSKEKIGKMIVAWRNTEYRQIVRGKIGRNAPCPCGSRKKYKKCCLI